MIMTKGNDMSEQDIMPKSVDMPTKCPSCGRLFDYTMYPKIHIPGDNKLKKKVLNKTLFFPKCPYCQEDFKLKATCLYINEDRRELFAVMASKDIVLDDLMKTGDIKLSDATTEEDVIDSLRGLFKRRIVYDVDAFREKILLSEYNYDDRIMELMKYSLSGLLEKDNHIPVYRIFLEESSGNQLVFTAIMGARAPFDIINVRTQASVYNHFRNQYLNMLDSPEKDEYIYTDQNWAAKSGLLKDGDAGFVIPL